MLIKEFFSAIDVSEINYRHQYEEGSWYQVFSMREDSSSLENKKVALIGIDDGHYGTIQSNNVRTFLYSLKNTDLAEQVVDLGNYKFDYSLKAYQGLGFALSEIMSLGVVPVILNGRQQITYAQYLAFNYLKKYFNLVTIDNRIDFNLNENIELTERNYLQTILTQEPSYLFHYTNLGHQIYFENEFTYQFLEKLNFNLHRLGEIRQDLFDYEPIMRNAHLVSFDLNSIRQSDSPGGTFPSPNGLYNEEACQLVRYAGMSPNVNTIGFFEYDPTLDINHQTAHQVAQMIWFFVEGVTIRHPESPKEDRDNFVKFVTPILDNSSQIIFFKSKRTDRWWMEVPVSGIASGNNTQIIPCTIKDFHKANRQEIPDRWWNALKKFS